MSRNNSSAGGGIGFVGLLQLVFIVLKLCKVIEWSWWMVFMPSIVTAGLYALVLVLCLFVRGVR